MFINVTVEGISPLLMHCFTDEAQQAMQKTSKSSIKKGAELPRDIAETHLYKDNDGNIAIPSNMMFSSIMSAGIYHKLGKKQITTRDSSLVPAGIEIEAMFIPVVPWEWEVDSRPIFNQKANVRAMAHRPRFDKWSLTFVLKVDNEMFSANVVRDLVDDAGKKCGIGAFRPNRKGPFGKFVVTFWEVIE
jgi:hypothetical protein